MTYRYGVTGDWKSRQQLNIWGLHGIWPLKQLYVCPCVLVCFIFFLYFMYISPVCFSCQYQCKWLSVKTHFQNDLLCVERDVKLYSLTHYDYTFDIDWACWQILQIPSYAILCFLSCVVGSIMYTVLVSIQAWDGGTSETETAAGQSCCWVKDQEAWRKSCIEWRHKCKGVICYINLQVQGWYLCTWGNCCTEGITCSTHIQVQKCYLLNWLTSLPVTVWFGA